MAKMYFEHLLSQGKQLNLEQSRASVVFIIIAVAVAVQCILAAMNFNATITAAHTFEMVIKFGGFSI